jgi:hypothetical protein
VGEGGVRWHSDMLCLFACAFGGVGGHSHRDETKQGERCCQDACVVTALAGDECSLRARWTSHRRLLHVDTVTGRMQQAVEPSAADNAPGSRGTHTGLTGVGACTGHRSFHCDAHWCMHVHRSSTRGRSVQSWPSSSICFMRSVAPKVYFLAEVITRAVTARRIPRLDHLIVLLQPQRHFASDSHS